MATAPPTSKLDRARRLSQRIDTVRASVRGARSKEVHFYKIYTLFDGWFRLQNILKGTNEVVVIF